MKKDLLKKLASVASELDSLGMVSEANTVDGIMRHIAADVSDAGRAEIKRSIQTLGNDASALHKELVRLEGTRVRNKDSAGRVVDSTPIHTVARINRLRSELEGKRKAMEALVASLSDGTKLEEVWNFDASDLKDNLDDSVNRAVEQGLADATVSGETSRDIVMPEAKIVVKRPQVTNVEMDPAYLAVNTKEKAINPQMAEVQKRVNTYLASSGGLGRAFGVKPVQVNGKVGDKVTWQTLFTLFPDWFNGAASRPKFKNYRELNDLLRRAQNTFG